jgi:hypothetical protein
MRAVGRQGRIVGADQEEVVASSGRRRKRLATGCCEDTAGTNMRRRKGGRKGRNGGVQEVRSVTRRLVVWSPTPEGVGVRLNRRRPAAGMEKGTAKRGRLGASQVNSFDGDDQHSEAVPGVASDWKGRV